MIVMIQTIRELKIGNLMLFINKQFQYLIILFDLLEHTNYGFILHKNNTAKNGRTLKFKLNRN